MGGLEKLMIKFVWPCTYYRFVKEVNIRLRIKEQKKYTLLIANTVKPVLSDHAWAQKKWSLNTGGLLVQVLSITTRVPSGLCDIFLILYYRQQK